jgi:hypothetical protein
MTAEELDKQLIDVRKAYRLLYDYQLHVLDLARVIGSKLGYNTVYGYPAFSGSAPKEGKKGVFDLWSWDWLNMYHYKFSFGSKKINDQEVFFDIHIISDSGFYDRQSAIETDTTTFKSAEESVTRIVLYAALEEYKWHEILKDSSSIAKDIRSAAFKWPSEDKVMVYGKSLALKDFIDSASTENSIRIFREACHENNITV